MEPTPKHKFLDVASGATPIGNAVRVPDEFYQNKETEVSIFRVTQITLHILPSGRQNKVIKYDSIKCAIPKAKSTRQYILRTPKLRSISECRKFAKVRPQIRSAGRGIAKDCALLLLSVSTDTKKNPNGRVRYPINLTGTRQNGKTLSGTCRSLHQYPEIMSRDVILK